MEEEKMEIEGVDEESLVIIQAYIRTYREMLLFDKMVKQSYLRGQKINELMQTEVTYLEKLQNIVELYQKPSEEFLSPKENNVVFSKISEIALFTSAFQAALATEIERGQEAKIGSVLLKYFSTKQDENSNSIQAYVSYCSNYGKVHTELNKLKTTNSKFKDLIEKTEKNPRCGEDLESSLIRVVQRIPQMNMILGDVVKYTPREHPDYENLSLVASELHQLGVVINEYIRETEGKEKLQLFAPKIKGFHLLAVESRRFIFDAPFKEIIGEEEIPRHIFLFNDMLLLSTPPKSKTEDTHEVEFYTPLIQISSSSIVTKSLYTEDKGNLEFVIRVKRENGSDVGINLKARKMIEKEYFLKNLDTSTKSATKGERETNVQIYDEEGKTLAKTLRTSVECENGTNFLWATPIIFYESKNFKKPKPNSYLAVSKYKIYIIDTTTILAQHHIFRLNTIKSCLHSEVELVFVEDHLVFAALQADAILNTVRFMYLQSFHCIKFIEEVHPSRVLFMDLEEKGACGGLVDAYHAVCDYLRVKESKEMLWLMHHVFVNGKVLNFSIFKQPLPLEDLKAFLMALLFNQHFTEMVVEEFVNSREIFHLLVYYFENTKSRSVEKLILKKIDFAKENGIALMKALGLQSFGMKRIEFANAPFDERALKFLGESLSLFQLQSLNLSNLLAKDSPELFSSIKDQTTLTNLHLEGFQLCVKSATQLHALLTGPNNLQTLELPYLKFGKMDNFVFYHFLSSPTLSGLAKLDLSGNVLQDSGIKFLSYFLASSKNLNHLNISYCNLSGEEFFTICEKIDSNPYLEKFTLKATNNSFTPHTGAKLGDFLKYQKGVIESMDVSDNDFGDEGMVYIFENLFTSQSPKRFYANRTFDSKVGKGGDHIRNRLKLAFRNVAQAKDFRLKTLHIAGSPQIKSKQLKDSLHPLLSALFHVTTISDLNLSGHKMGYNGAIAISHLVSLNPNIKKLYWDDNGTNLLGLKYFLTVLQNSCNLVESPVPMNDALQIISTEPASSVEVMKVVADIQTTIAVALSQKIVIPPKLQRTVRVEKKPLTATNGWMMSKQYSRLGQSKKINSATTLLEEGPKNRLRRSSSLHNIDTWLETQDKVKQEEPKIDKQEETQENHLERSKSQENMSAAIPTTPNSTSNSSVEKSTPLSLPPSLKSSRINKNSKSPEPKPTSSDSPLKIEPYPESFDNFLSSSVDENLSPRRRQISESIKGSVKKLKLSKKTEEKRSSRFATPPKEKPSPAEPDLPEGAPLRTPDSTQLKKTLSSRQGLISHQRLSVKMPEPSPEEGFRSPLAKGRTLGTGERKFLAKREYGIGGRRTIALKPAEVSTINAAVTATVSNSGVSEGSGESVGNPFLDGFSDGNIEEEMSEAQNDEVRSVSPTPRTTSLEAETEGVSEADSSPGAPLTPHSPSTFPLMDSQTLPPLPLPPSHSSQHSPPPKPPLL